jgi:selenocysteine lyase/cysteine desulfurase
MNASEQFKMGRRAFVRGLAALSLPPLAATQSLASDLAGVPVPGRFHDWVADDDPRYWSWIRQQFSIPPGEAYFNTGTLGACPRPVQDAVVESMVNMEKTIAHYDYRPEHPEYIAGYRPQEELRKKAGEILNANTREIALLQNATMGINFIANGLTLEPGDEVLVAGYEHPAVVGAWDLRAKRQGIVVRKLDLPVPTPDPQSVLKIFADALGPRVKVIAVPHVTSRLGIVMPVQELCDLARARGVFTLMDGAQAAGQLRVDVKKMGCDAYVCSPHKWLLAPPGNGLLYVREERQRDLWATLASAHWNDYEPGTGLFRLMQFGTANAALLAGLDAALDFYQRVGPEKIERRTLSLADQLRDGLKKIKGVEISSPLHSALAGAIVTYGVQGLAAMQLQDELWNRKKYRVRAQVGQLVRQSVHYYNSPEEIEGTLEVVRLLAAK